MNEAQPLPSAGEEDQICLQLVKRTRQRPMSCGTRAKERYKQSGWNVMEELEVKRALKGVLKDKDL